MWRARAIVLLRNQPINQFEPSYIYICMVGIHVEIREICMAGVHVGNFSCTFLVLCNIYELVSLCMWTLPWEKAEFWFVFCFTHNVGFFEFISKMRLFCFVKLKLRKLETNVWQLVHRPTAYLFRILQMFTLPRMFGLRFWTFALLLILTRSFSWLDSFLSLIKL